MRNKVKLNVVTYGRMCVCLWVISPILISCTPIDERDLLGTYIAKFGFGTEIITFKSNGKYIQEVIIKEVSKTIVHEGNWRYDPKDKYIEMENGLAIVSPTGKLKKDHRIPFPGLVLRKVKRLFPWSRISLTSGYVQVQYQYME